MRTRNWRLIGAALAVVVTVAVGAGVMWWHQRDERRSPVDWRPPAQAMLPAMRVAPVVGWRLSAADFGLPPDARFVTSDILMQSNPYVGHLGDVGYFLANRPGTDDWWLVGVDTGDEQSLFPPVALTSVIATPPSCYLNGTTAVLCLRDDAAAAAAWVVDAHTGTVTFTGPTRLSPLPGRLGVEQVGEYSIAGDAHRGVSGVGPTADPTWFVPGNGEVDQRYRTQSDFGEQPLATQLAGDPGSESRVVFRLSDGAVLTPQLDTGRQPIGAVVYPGGFATETGTVGRAADPDEIRFFDTEGKELGRVGVAGKLRWESPDVPIVETPGGATVYTPDGRDLARLPPFGAGVGARLIGSRLFVDVGASSDFPRWTQYDLHTGARGATCDANFNLYLGTDGQAAVIRVANPAAGLVAKAVDLNTCEILWKLPARAQSYARVFRVDTTLVQVSDDGSELMSLVAQR